MTPKRLESLRGKSLQRFISRYGAVSFDDSSYIVDLQEHKKLLKKVEKAKELGKDYGSIRPIGSPKHVKSYKGYIRYKEFIEQASKPVYWSETQEKMVDNFMQSMSYMGVNTQGYKLVYNRVKELGVTATAKILQNSVWDFYHITPSFLFSSDPNIIKNTLNIVFEYLGIPYDDNVDYYEENG